MAAKAYGIDPKKLKIVVFGGGAESVTNLLGGHIDALSAAVNNPIPHHKAGTMRILCVTSEERSPTVPDAPTCREQGVDVVTENWTILIGPKNLSPEQKVVWEKIVQETAQDAGWLEYLEKNAWSKAYKNAEQSKEYLEAQYTLTKDILKDIGMTK
jgi:putative tricarboxylic transport membrane protein